MRAFLAESYRRIRELALWLVVTWIVAAVWSFLFLWGNTWLLQHTVQMIASVGGWALGFYLIHPNTALAVLAVATISLICLAIVEILMWRQKRLNNAVEDLMDDPWTRAAHIVYLRSAPVVRD